MTKTQTETQTVPSSPEQDSRQWPVSPQSMTDMTDWGKVTCGIREKFFAAFGTDLTILSSLTDPDGQFGPGTVYTEWGTEGGKPWLRDYRPTSGTCRHYMPTANIAWPTETV